MKNIFPALFFSLLSFISIGQNNPDAILGKWITTTGDCIIEVYKQNTEFKAKLVWFKEGKKKMNDYKDEKNPNPDLRGRKILGMDVVDGMHYDADEKQWVDGIIYDASSGKKWDSVAWLTDDNLLKVKGYWLFKFLSETRTFKKA
jgi:uncharacterized protein (DUF2147 family)